MTDEEIVGHVQSGDTRSFTDLVERHQDAVFGMALRFTRCRTDAEDMAQEAFLKAFRSLPGFRGEAKFSTWLYRITYNLCVDWLRRKKRPGGASPAEDPGDATDRRVDLEGGLILADERERVRRAVEELEEKYRGVVVLLYYQKMSYEQIGAVLGLPVKTVETRLYRARRMLREKLEQT